MTETGGRENRQAGTRAEDFIEKCLWGPHTSTLPSGTASFRRLCISISLLNVHVDEARVSLSQNHIPLFPPLFLCSGKQYVTERRR
ncbi:hypothetical protein AVEN_247479-1, partial [Araneus ventricosus]